MGKRSAFARVPRDFYPTPYEAVVPLLPHLQPGTRFYEPCCGKGDLIVHLARHDHVCVGSSDIGLDARTATYPTRAWTFITNPPWDRAILHPIIANLSDQLPTWLLFDADWMHTQQSAKFMPRLRKIVSVGRVKWIPDSKMTGKDNAAWYLFDRLSRSAPEFFGRKP